MFTPSSGSTTSFSASLIWSKRSGASEVTMT
jgi:hypothetical protein